MDAVDAQILRLLGHPANGHQWDVRVSWPEIGRLAGVDAETVRVRVARMTNDGVLRGWDVGVNASLLGRQPLRVEVPPAHDDEEARRRLAALAAMDGPLLAFEDQARGLGVVLHVLPEAWPRQRALLEAAVGPVAAMLPAPMPPAEVELTRADWRLVRALRKDPRRTHAELSAESGMSSRTLRRRIERLTEGKALFLLPRIVGTQIRGMFPVEVRVVHANEEARRGSEEILRRLPRSLFASFEGTTSRASLLAERIGELEELRTQLEALPETRSVQVRFFVRRSFFDGWLEEEVARRADSGAPARAPIEHGG